MFINGGNQLTFDSLRNLHGRHIPGNPFECLNDERYPSFKEIDIVRTVNCALCSILFCNALVIYTLYIYSLQLLEPKVDTVGLSDSGIDILKETLKQYDVSKQQLILRMKTSHLHLLLFSFRCTESSSFLINLFREKGVQRTLDSFIGSFNFKLLSVFYRVNF